MIKIKETTVEHYTPFIQLIKKELENGDSWYYVKRTGDKEAVSVIPFTKNNEIILIEHYRYPVNKNVIEFPAGIIDTDDDLPEDTAWRELREETGYVGMSGIMYEQSLSSSGLSTEKVWTAILKDCVKLYEQKLEPLENIKVHIVHTHNLNKFIEQKRKEGCEISSRVQYFAIGLEYRNI